MTAQGKMTPHGAPIHEKRLLPVQPPGQVIGRNRELALMHVTLKDGASLLIAGPSGIGKSTLAAVLATAHIASTPGGVLWLHLNDDDLPDIAARVGRAYDEDTFTGVGGDWDRTTATVRKLLQENRPLIIFDGLIDLHAVREFIRQCAPEQSFIIITDRAVPGPWTAVELAPLSERDAETLFRYYSGIKVPDQAADVEALVKSLDGHPLTLELAARQCRVEKLSVAELVAALPPGSRVGATPLLTLAFKRLDTAAQGVMLILASLFAPSTGVELLTLASKLSTSDAVQQARKLVTRAIAREHLSYGQVRFRLHPAAREYGRSWLQSFGRLSSLENRALSSVLSYTERFAQNKPEAHERLADESENIVGAAQYAAESDHAASVEALIDALENKAEDFILERNFWLELEQLKRILREAEPATPAPDEPAPPPTPAPAPAAKIEPPVVVPAPPVLVTPEPPPLPEEKIEVAPEPEPELEPEPSAQTQPLTPAKPPAWLPPSQVTQPTPTAPTVPSPAIPKLGLARLDAPTSDAITLPPVPAEAPPDVPPQETAAALSSVEPPLAVEDTDLSSSTGAMQAAAVTVETEAVDEDTERHTPPSVASIRDMLVEARAQGDKEREGLLLQSLGQYNLDVGRSQDAEGYFKEALEAFEAANNSDGMLAVLEVLSSLASYKGNAQDALIYATRGVNFAQQLDDKSRLGRLQTRLGDIRTALGDTTAAAETYSAAIETLRGAEDWIAVGVAMSKLAAIYLNQSRSQEALQLLEPALTIFQRERRADQEARTLAKLGNVYTALGDWSKAQAQHEQAALLAKQQYDQAGEAEQYAALGYLRELQRDRDGSILFYRRALHAAYEAGNTDLQIAAAVQLGEFLIEDTRTLNQGIQLLREVSDKSTEAKRLLGRADQRLRRASGAGVVIPAANVSNRDYAAQAYVA
ncbi:MAG: tetratricopeptide repeat protein [Anaerolineae bacterium]|nr:tetratricopeptide repeat protein [Anaerolineae bacterium]